MRLLLAFLGLLYFRDPPPRVEVKGVEISGAWLTLTERSYVAVYLRGPDGLRLLTPDSATTWAG